MIDVYKRCTSLPVHPRHPWAGELVYAAFSGSHQDAIRKSMAYHREHDKQHWDVAYLPIDPRDLGRRYEEVVRINSQSGKGGVALVLERDHGIALPKWMHPVLSAIVQREADRCGREITSLEVRSLFEAELLAVPDDWQLAGYESRSEKHRTVGHFRLARAGAEVVVSGGGQGLVEALIDALQRHTGASIAVESFEEHALEAGTAAKALASVIVDVDGRQCAACWIDEDSAVATLQAILSAVGHSPAVAQAFKAAV
jgi:2-isopropylmalate synthase